MCHSATVLTTILFFIQTNGESTEEQHYTYTNFYAPSTVNFHDIYTNSLSLLSEEPTLTTLGAKDEDFHINNVPSQYVEFHLQPQVVTTMSPPSPKYISNALDSKENDTESLTATSKTTTTEGPEETSVKVVPIKKDFQRGVLDLLFPATRVRSFKNVFDSVRRILSYTFRK